MHKINNQRQAQLLSFGKTAAGEPVDRVLLSDGQGLEVVLLSLGASIQRIKIPDLRGRPVDVALFCDDLDGYLKQLAYLGATTGRYANRIGNSHFRLQGKNYLLPANDGSHHLHGGPNGFDKRIWKTDCGYDGQSCFARFELKSADGDQGYPGELITVVEYRLADANRLEINIQASSTAPTVVNISNHAYFNLSGDPFGGLENHEFVITANEVCEIDAECLPTGKILPLQGSVLNLQSAADVSDLLRVLPAELRNTGGFDHNYVFEDNAMLSEKAIVLHRSSGRKLTVFSTQPGLQFYTGNHLCNCKVYGHGGRQYQNHSGFCLEPQHFPDSPNHANFPTTRLEPGETYQHKIVYQFETG